MAMSTVGEAAPAVPAASVADPKPARQRWLRWLPLGVSSVQVIPCAALVAVSAYHITLGGASLLAAAAAVPFEYFHRDAIRIPLFLLAGLGSLVNLYLLWKSDHLRSRPSAQWRIVPRTPAQNRIRRFQLVSSLVTLALIVGDIVSHKLRHV